MAQLGTITIQAPTDAFLTLAEVCRVIDRTDKVVKAWVKAGYFPPSIPLGGKEVWTNLAVGVWMAWVQVCPQKPPEAPDSE